MARILNSFKVRSGNKILDYRTGENLDLEKIKIFFQKNYQVEKLWKGSRHVLGLVKQHQKTYFLKLSTSEGISIITKNEYKWNNYFNQYFPKKFPYLVPKNYDSGLFQEKYFYLVTDYFAGPLLCGINETGKTSNRLIKYLDRIIEFSSLIQTLPGVETANLPPGNHQQKFLEKVNKWFADIPDNVISKYRIKELLAIVENGANVLLSKPRHGDFAPWHIIKMNNKGLVLIDGEHYLPDGVENYDICYFIQRVFSILKNPALARDIYSRLLALGYKKEKLKTVLAARAIGGFLDESLADKPDYTYAENFKKYF